MPVLPRLRSPAALRSAAVGAGSAFPAAPLLTAADKGSLTAVVVASVALAVVVAVATVRARPRPAPALFGAVLVGVASLLLAVTPPGAITALIAVVLGAGAGLVMPTVEGADRRLAVFAAAVVAASVGVLTLAGGTGVGLRLVAVTAVAVAAVAAAEGQPGPRVPEGRRRRLPVTGVSLLAAGLVLWVAGNDPAVGWFGPVVSHGPRERAEVALTFDDGPDPRWSPEVARLLDERGVKATFFQVGSAVDAHPDVSRSLLSGGHLLANHSYHHDYWRWLDPRYPELDRAGTAFERNLGVCPAFFRPPHGQRTPFMVARVRQRGMKVVTWDVSARDWSDTDPQRVAQRVLDGVRPGSIVLLHDGLDGAGGADRSVVVGALPLILDGLEGRGLQPVRLDDLLDRSGYRPC
ncbi:MAG: polysaccharide deacetylase family protein [Acidimicrobiia bacterium]